MDQKPPDYRSLEVASFVLRWGAAGLAILYFLARLIGGYLKMYGDDYSEVTYGLGGYLIETALVLAALGVCYTIGEAALALRDIARNSFHT